jgi:predicted RNase H-like HicB family nuclease
MQNSIATLEYWIDNGWYVGRLREIPGVFSQGTTLEDLEFAIRDAYAMMLAENTDETLPQSRFSKPFELVV